MRVCRLNLAGIPDDGVVRDAKSAWLARIGITKPFDYQEIGSVMTRSVIGGFGWPSRGTAVSGAQVLGL